MRVKKEVVVKQEESLVQTEVLASAIVELSAAARKLLNSGLRTRTVALLLNEDIPPRYGLSRSKIEAVLEALPLLQARHTTKVTK